MTAAEVSVAEEKGKVRYDRDSAERVVIENMTSVVADLTQPLAERIKAAEVVLDHIRRSRSGERSW